LTPCVNRRGSGRCTDNERAYVSRIDVYPSAEISASDLAMTVTFDL